MKIKKKKKEKEKCQIRNYTKTSDVFGYHIFGRSSNHSETPFLRQRKIDFRIKTLD